MSTKSAKRLAEHLKPSAVELQVENRAAAMLRAMKEGDPEAVLKTATSIVKLSEGHSLTDAGERYLDGVVSAATKFAEDPGLFSFEEDDEDEESDLNEGRDFFGRRVTKSLDEETNPRDAFGRALPKTLPFDLEDEDEDFEVEDDIEDLNAGRDHFGRRIKEVSQL